MSEDIKQQKEFVASRNPKKLEEKIFDSPFIDKRMKELLELKRQLVITAISHDNRKGKELDRKFDELINLIKSM